MSSRRTRIDIIQDMLEAIQKKQGKIKPTHLMYKANLSHKLLNDYVKELTDKGLIATEMFKKKPYFILTDKGLEFLNQLKKMKEFQEAFGL